MTETAPTPGTPEYDQSMVAKVDAAQGVQEQQPETPSIPQRPDDIPEKFWDAEAGQVNAEALLQSYRALESRYSRERSSKEGGEETDAATPVISDDQMSRWQEEFNQAGMVTDQMYDELAAAGLSREVVDAYVEGQQALVDAQESALLGEVGGKDQFKAMSEWAENNWSEASLDAYNALVESGSPNAVKQGLKMLQQAYQDANGSDPQMITGSTTGSKDAGGYPSVQAMQADMRKPEYKKDPAFRADVQRRVALTDMALLKGY